MFSLPRTALCHFAFPVPTRPPAQLREISGAVSGAACPMWRNGNTEHDTWVAVGLVAARETAAATPASVAGLAEDVVFVGDEMDERDEGQRAAGDEGGVGAHRQL